MGCSLSSKNRSTKRVELSKTEKKIIAAVLIQKWYRMYVARLEARRRYTWTIFQSIEYSGEQDQLKLHDFFNSMIKQLSLDNDGQPMIAKAFTSIQRPAVHAVESSDVFGCIGSLNISESYTGPHLTFPITHAQVKTLIQAFKAKKRLHVRYLLELIKETCKILQQCKNINYASTSISKQITVCGDLHGKLEDLYVIFHKNGLPSMDNPYVFNGDFVDRGKTSVEVIVILFACFLTSPNEVFLNRGNHEDHVMNIRYGFNKEIMHKYKENAVKVTKAFEEVFSWLPLATVIDNKVFVVHGGISDNFSLNSLAKLNRHQYISVLRPPTLSKVDNFNFFTTKMQQLEEWKMVLDILWSDPKCHMGCHPNTFRGGGCYFGPDVTKKFLNEHNFKLLIRAHECKPEGFEYNHDGKLLTIFSASNYYDIGSNKGAFVKLLGTDLQCHIIQFQSNETHGLRKLTFTQRISFLEASAMQDLREKILALRSDLVEEFKKYDTEETGTITVSDWCSVMESLMNVDVPWRLLRSKLVQLNSEKRVIYETTFEQLKISHRYSENGASVMELLYRYKDSLETIFHIFDKDNSGYISMPEFEEACELLIRHTSMNLSPVQIKDIAKSMDFNGDGQIDFNEFLEAFRIVNQNGLQPVYNHSNGENMNPDRTNVNVTGEKQIQTEDSVVFTPLENVGN